MNNNRYYLLTGAAGFLGSNICAQLLAEGKKVRALVLPNDKSVKFIPKEVEVVIGDLCDADSLEPFFAVPEGCTTQAFSPMTFTLSRTIWVAVALLKE